MSRDKKTHENTQKMERNGNIKNSENERFQICDFDDDDDNDGGVVTFFSTNK